MLGGNEKFLHSWQIRVSDPVWVADGQQRHACCTRAALVNSPVSVLEKNPDSTVREGSPGKSETLLWVEQCPLKMALHLEPWSVASFGNSVITDGTSSGSRRTRIRKRHT